MGDAHEGQCPPAMNGKASQLKPWLQALDGPQWSEGWMFAKYDMVSTELWNTAKMSVLGITWLRHLSFLYEPCRFSTSPGIFVFYPSPLKCIASIFMLLTQRHLK